MAVYPSLPIKPYDQLRHHIRSGDILLCSGDSLFSNLIKQATRSIWSHVAFILRLDIIDRIMVLESVESIGVRAVPLSSYVRDYNGTNKGYPGHLVLARHSELKQDKIKNLSKMAVDLLGYPYNTEEVVRIATRIGTSSLGLPTSSIDTPTGREFICSEYAHVCFKSVGVSVNFNSLGFIAPEDFARCQQVEMLSYIQTERKPTVCIKTPGVHANVVSA